MRISVKNGGVIGVNFYAAYVNEQDASGARILIKGINAVDTNLSDAELATYSEKDRVDSGLAHPTVGRAAIADVVACIQHATKVAGIDHVGIGADFDGISVPEGLEDVSKMPALRRALAKSV